MMRVTFIGTGGAFSNRYGHSNALVEVAGVRLMVDFGYEAPALLRRASRGVEEVTHVVITHLHADHVGGLEDLAFISRFFVGSRPFLIVHRDLRKRLWNACLKGGLEWVTSDEGKPMRCGLETYFEVIEVGEEWLDCGGLRLRLFATDHVPGMRSYGVVVGTRDGEETVVFSSDTRRRLAQLDSGRLDRDFARGPIFHDCQLVDTGSGSVHISLNEVLRYPQEIRRRLALIHYGDRIGEHLDVIARAGIRVAWPGVPVHLPGWSDDLDRSVEGFP